MRRYVVKYKDVVVSRPEWAAIKTERLKCQRAAAAAAGYESVYDWCCIPGTEHRIDILGRALDGCLLVAIVCYGQGLTAPYRRRIRMVPEATLKV